MIGVMPATFTHRGGDFYVPLQRKLDPATRGNHFLATYARLKPGVPLDRATTEMRALGVVLAKEFGHNHGIDVRSYREVVVGSIRGPLQVLMGAVLCVLLIACFNVANLLLASGMSRRREIAVRLALGAGQKDVARQLTCESLLLALAGGTLGLLLAIWIVRVFVVLAANNLPRAATIHVDGRVLAFTAAISILVGLVCGLSPLLRLRLKTLTTALREGDTRTGSGGGGTFGNGLVIGEIAVAFALLVGAGLMVKNLLLLERRDAGISVDHVIAFDISPSGPRYRDGAAISALYRALDERLAQLGGVQHVGLTSHLPMYRFGNNGEMTREGGNPWGANDNPLVEYRYLYGDYLKALGIPLLRGRALDSRDGANTNGVLDQPGDGGQVLARRGSDRQALRPGPRPQDLLHRGRRDRQHPVVRAGRQVAVRVLPDDRPGAVRRDDGRAALVRCRALVAHPERAGHRRQSRPQPAGHRRADDGGGGERVGGAAAPAVGALRTVRRPRRACSRWSASTA